MGFCNIDESEGYFSTENEICLEEISGCVVLSAECGALDLENKWRGYIIINNLVK